MIGEEYKKAIFILRDGATGVTPSQTLFRMPNTASALLSRRGNRGDAVPGFGVADPDTWGEMCGAHGGHYDTPPCVQCSVL